MKSSSQSKRALIPFVPDLPYHIQTLFMLCMCFIWSRAFVHDYDSDLPDDPDAVQKIHVSFYLLIILSPERKLAARHHLLHSFSLLFLVFEPGSHGHFQSLSAILENNYDVEFDVLLFHYRDA